MASCSDWGPDGRQRPYIEVCADLLDLVFYQSGGDEIRRECGEVDGKKEDAECLKTPRVSSPEKV